MKFSLIKGVTLYYLQRFKKEKKKIRQLEWRWISEKITDMKANQILLREASISVFCHEDVDWNRPQFYICLNHQKSPRGRMIAVFHHQITAAYYVKIITLSKSTSGWGLREGSPTACSHTHSDCRPACMVCVHPGVNHQHTSHKTRVIAWVIFRKGFTPAWAQLHIYPQRCVQTKSRTHTFTCAC